MNNQYKRKNLEWKPLFGHEDEYEISNYGDFHILLDDTYKWSEELPEFGGNSANGHYLGIKLKGEKYKLYAHRLAAQTFIANPENKPEVNHKDGVTNNNYCGCKENNYQDSNLEWVTHKENVEHAVKNGLINHHSVLRKMALSENRKKIDYEKMKKAIYQISCEGEIVQEFPSAVDAAKILGYNAHSIQTVTRNDGIHKTYNNYVWVKVSDYDPNKDYSVIITHKSEKTMKAVVQKTMKGEFVAEYESIQEACRQNGFSGAGYISECCKGKRKHYKNYIWTYK